MNVVTPKLLPSEYGAANDLKTEVRKAQLAAKQWPKQATAINRFFGELVAPLPATSAVVTDGQELAVTGGTVTLHVAAGVVTATYEASGT